ncbi:TrkH family potassium uptake protein [Lutispora saccharofermentans]|uniref:TrkH family potassium uptake protein n=1 Tax=Lutispora saccharofermentans TaxID=3024236 RepID=A0ABT1NHY2_9FIRM|nr:TrkH family potassium uptake protein [Lutispora saccharofermentans]
MNFKMVLKSLGILLICEAIAITPSLAVSGIYNDGAMKSFAYTLLMLIAAGLALINLKPQSKSIYARDGFAIVGFGWVLVSFFGSLPFYLSGSIPSLVDSFFEAVSGFTTTGASILTEVESLPKSILFWRSFTHWVGGMGVLVLTLAILPSVGAGTLQIMKAESPGPNPGKLVPRVGKTAKILYGIYFVITVVQIIFLIIAGMPVFDACIHTFGTVGTGGFSSKNISVGAYNNVFAEVIITVFMLMCGANFSLYYQVIKGNFKALFKDGEFRFYIGVVSLSIILITIDLYGNIFSSVGESLRHSSFQVASIITTTGYSSTDFDKWPIFSKLILFFLMFIGGCAGSTGGGIKNIRILLLIKAMKTELMQIIHPRAVYPVRIGGRAVDERTLSEIKSFFFAYIFIFVAASLIVSLDDFDIVTTLSSVAATLGNIGPGFAVVGPMGNFSAMSVLSKMTLSFAMLIGRLEIYPILLLAMPGFWKKVSI